MDIQPRQHPSGDGRIPVGLLLVLMLGVPIGCSNTKVHLDETLARQKSSANLQALEGQYRAACPDVLHLETANRPDLTGLRSIGADGRIDLIDGQRLRVEGLTTPEIAQCVAREVALPSSAVTVRIGEHHSQKVYLFGEVTGMQRSVDYIGPEPVLDLLHRTGGITPGAAVRDVHVIRSHIVDGRNPEVFHIDLEAILQKGDQTTNIRIEPFDQIYVGQNRPSFYEKTITPCFRPLYEALFGLRRD
jgi:protein involved in polysaccharide export with SLBB domain